MPGQTLQDRIRAAAKQHGVPESLALAVAEKESSFNPEAIGPEIPSMPGVRAIGTFQLLPSTGKMLGVDPNDHFANIDGGVKYLRQLLDASQGDVDLTLKTYGGFKTVDPTAYITDINARMAKFRTAPGGPATAPGARLAAAAGAPSPGMGGGPGATGRASGAGPGPAPATVASTPELEMPTPGGIARAIGAPFDPRTPEGRQNLAATALEVGVSFVPGLGPALRPAVGAAVRTATTGAKVAGVVRRVAVPAVAAGIGGGGEAAIEQAITPRGLGDLITGEPPTSPLRIGLEQAAYSVGGETVMWPVRRVVKALIGGRIATQAATGTAEAVTATQTAGRQATHAIREKTEEALEAARVVKTSTQDATKAMLARQTGNIRAANVQRLADVELDNAALLSRFTKEYDDLLSPSVAGTVTATRTVIEGPAKRALEMAGQRVEDAALTGPMIKLAPIQDTLRQMIAKARPSELFGHASAATPTGAAGSATDSLLPPPGTKARDMTSEQVKAVQAQIAQSMNLPEIHPLPGLLGQLMAAPEEITFQTAHQIKRLLDEGVNWDVTAKKHLQSITKGIRVSLREALSVHEPYNIATAAYHGVVPLYQRGVGKKLKTALLNNPDAAARLLKDNDPIQAQALKDLLVTQSAAGGDVKAGKLAWDLVRSSYAYDALIKQGADGLGDRVATLMRDHPEFVRVFADDATGRQVLNNLARIGDAITSTTTANAGRTAAAKATGRADLTAGKEAAAQVLADTRAKSTAAVSAQRKAGRAEVQSVAERARLATEAAKSTQQRLKDSAISKTGLGEFVTDIVAGSALGPRSWFGARYLMRALTGPKAADLLEWAAYSDRNTQRLTQALLGPIPNQAMSILLRDIGGVLGDFGVVEQPASGGGVAPAMTDLQRSRLQ